MSHTINTASNVAARKFIAEAVATWPAEAYEATARDGLSAEDHLDLLKSAEAHGEDFAECCGEVTDFCRSHVRESWGWSVGSGDYVGVCPTVIVVEEGNRSYRPLRDDEQIIDVVDDFADGYDANGVPGKVEIAVTVLDIDGGDLASGRYTISVE